ncbi:MAG: flagellar L-ring protein precursor FlgH [Hyphomonadaceae bacterium]|nr:MAG: flagellar L-ring protein precursor FlgH [Hyphomonadaceae bacterium]KAF0184362.1 MAG: flagellar L-ring protein precursor FlgH [Hyphomonadaceae bacterium]
MKRIAAYSLLLIIGLGGCASTRAELASVGRPPAMSPIQDPQMAATGRRQVVMPMPAPQNNTTSSNSLWQSGARQFFVDPRASKIGDILTVNIQIDDKAQLNNTTGRSRDGTISGGVSNFFGLENSLGRAFPAGFDPANMVNANGSGEFSGTGSINRQEKVTLTVAAIVTQVLPNGNFVVAGRQEVRVNNEVRELLVSGIVRPQDINSTNMVQHTQMAEARISYGGRGHITTYQQPSTGQQVLGILSPF